MVKNLILYQKIYDLILYSFPILNRFPKSQKFVLAQQIEVTMLKMLDLVMIANMNHDKIEHLRNLDIKLQALKTLIRLSKDLKFISLKRYQVFSIKLVEIGKILGGWINKYKG